MNTQLTIINSIISNENFDTFSMIGSKRLEGWVDYNATSEKLIQSIENSEFLVLNISDNGFPIDLLDIEIGKRYSIAIVDKRNTPINVFESWEKLLSTNIERISKGRKLEEFIIIEKNNDIPYENLKNLIDLISAIKTISTYHDDKTSSSKKYIFISHHADTKDFSEIEISLSIEILKSCVIDSNKLSIFQKEESTLTETDEDKWNIFSASIVEFCNEKLPKDNFIKITNNFNDLYTLYRNNYNVFQNKFKFQSLKREISEKHLEFIKKIEENTSSIYTKSLSIPLSVTAISGIQSLNNEYQSIPIIAGSLILALILSESIYEKIRFITNLKKTNEKLLDSDSKYPKEIEQLIKDKIKEVNSISSSAITKMKFLSLSGFIVSLCATLIWAKKHNIDDFLSKLLFC